MNYGRDEATNDPWPTFNAPEWTLRRMKVSFIVAHLGNFASRDWKEHVRAIEAAKDIPNLYLETSSVVFVNYLEQAANELPAEKLIFGSRASSFIKSDY